MNGQVANNWGVVRESHKIITTNQVSHKLGRHSGEDHERDF